MRASLSSLLQSKRAQLPQPLLIREMCPYKTAPRAFITDQVPFLPQCSALHPAARDIFRGGQHQPYLVHKATGGTCSAVPSKLALPPHLIPHTQFTCSPLGRQGVQCSCSMSHSSPWIFVGCKPTSLLLPHIVLLFPAVALGCAATMVTLVTTWCSKGAQGSPPGRYPAHSSSVTEIWCLWTWRMLEVPANPPPLLPRTLSHLIPSGMALPCLLVLFSLPFFFCS